MRLNIGAFGVAAGITAGLLSAICAIVVGVAPGPATRLVGYVIHLDLTGLARPVTLGSFLGGVCFWAIGTGLVFAFAGWLYNAVLGRKAKAGLLSSQPLAHGS